MHPKQPTAAAPLPVARRWSDSVVAVSRVGGYDRATWPGRADFPGCRNVKNRPRWRRVNSLGRPFMTGIRYKALLAGVVLTSATAAFALAGERKGGDVGGAASSSRAAAAITQPRAGARTVPNVKYDPDN